MRFLSFVCFFLGALAGAVGCSQAGSTTAIVEPSADDPVELSRRQIQRQARRASTWRFVYCLEEGTDGQALIDLLYEISKAEPFGRRIEVVNCDGLSPDLLASGPLNLFGNRIPGGGQNLPLTGTAETWTLTDGKTIVPGDVLFIWQYLNSWSTEPTVAGFFLSANPDDLVTRLRTEFTDNLDNLMRHSWAYALFRDDGDQVYGSYADNSWEFDPTQEMTMTAPDEPIYEKDSLQIFAYDGPVAGAAVQEVARQLTTIRDFTAGLSEGLPSHYPEVRIYPNMERMGLRTGQMNPVQYNSEEDILHVIPSALPDDELLLSFEAWLPFIDWTPGDDVSEALQKQAIAILQHQIPIAGLAERKIAALRLASTGVMELKRTETRSSYVEESRARFAAMRIGKLTPKALLTVLPAYEQGTPFPYVRGLPEDWPEEPAAFPRVLPRNEPLAGMTFAHEGYRIHNGYGGEKIIPSLDSLAELNANALAVVPYTFMRDPQQPTELFIPDRAGQENDWATIRSVREAQSRGWFVLLKPQIWVGGGHWPGEVDFTTEEEWEAFFEHYTYWIMHYALLAQREQIGALCLGTELVQTTLKHPDRWRIIIEKVRAVYGGQLTYAANWGPEFEGFTFWEDLDAIGLNSYYPLSEADAPTDEDLLVGARRWLAMAAKVSRENGRPLWLTEVGYRSVTSAWKNPHAEAGGRRADPATQARCYKALLTAAAATPELKGMFVWKWPSYLGEQNFREPGTRFTPGGKPAAQLLGRFYGSWLLTH